MHVITRKRLRDFAWHHPDAAEPLDRWFHVVAKTDFESFSSLRKTFSTADKVGRFTVFNIGGNKYRLITAIHYNRKRIYIRNIMTHAEYTTSNWNV